MVHFTRRFAGLLLILVGAWGGIVPYVGPAFGYRVDSTASFTWTTPHWELNLLPGIATIVAGLLILGGSWVSARFACLLGLAAGTWFVVGPLFASLWLGTGAETRVASSSLSQAWVPLGYHYGTGVVIVALAAYAYGRALNPARLIGAAAYENSMAAATTVGRRNRTVAAYPAEPATTVAPTTTTPVATTTDGTVADPAATRPI